MEYRDVLNKGIFKVSLELTVEDTECFLSKSFSFFGLWIPIIKKRFQILSEADAAYDTELTLLKEKGYDSTN